MLKFATLLVAAVGLLLFDGEASAQLTRSQLQAGFNATISANGRGAITGPVLNTQLSNIIPAFGAINDTNNWLGANAFPAITLGGNGGSTWSDFGSGVFYYTPLKDRTDIGVQGSLTFKAGGAIPLGPAGTATYYLDRAAVLRVTSPSGLGGVYGTCQSSRAITSRPPAWFSVTGPTVPTSGGSGGAAGPTTFPGVFFTGGSGNQLQQGDVTVSGGVATAINWTGYIAANGYVIGDVLTPATPLPVGFPTGVSVTVTSTQPPYCFGGAFVATNDSAAPYAASANGLYIETLRAAGAGNTGGIQLLTGNGGDIYGETPYPQPAAYSAGFTYGMLISPGGSAGIAPSIYVNPISADIVITNVPGGKQALKGIVFTSNCCVDAHTQIIPGGGFLGMVAIAFGQQHKIGWFTSNGAGADTGYGYLGSYLQGDVSLQTILENISFENSGAYIQGPSTVITGQQAALSNVSLDGGVTKPMFQVLGIGSTAQAIFEGAANTGAGIWASQYLITRGNGPGPDPAGAVVAGDNILLKGWGNDGLNFSPFAQIALQVAGTITNGTVPGTIIFSTWNTATPTNAKVDAMQIQSDQQVVILANALRLRNVATWTVANSGEGVELTSTTQGLRLGGRGSTCDVSLQNFGGGNSLCLLTGTTTINLPGILQVGTYTGSTCANSGYITLADSGGATRKFMICT